MTKATGVGRGCPRDYVIRFWGYINFDGPNGCWDWTGAQGKGHDSYGRLGGPNRTTLRVHRLSWEIHYGPVPEGMLVLHKCDRPVCLNPSHLFLGSYLDNNQDTRLKGRHKTPFQRKITDQNKTEIYQYHLDGKLDREIAVLFGVNRRTISSLIQKRGRHAPNMG